MSSLEESVRAALLRSECVRDVRLIGSRASGTHGRLSDWDFGIDTDDFPSVAANMPELVKILKPVCKQWDRLSDTWCYMLLLVGPIKVDLIFDEPHPRETPWVVSGTNLAEIDAHFWDWTLWIAAKDAAGKHDLVRRELVTMHEHLLGPMGAGRCDSLQDAIGEYLNAREFLERRLDVVVPRDVEVAVLGAIRKLP